jgi:preprotein translocase subunit SecE
VLIQKAMFKNIYLYCKDSYEELAHRTTWPTRKELTHSAIVVLIASVIIAIVVFAMDKVFETLMQLIYSIKF